MDTVPLEQFSAIPYLDSSKLGGRVVNLMAFWDGSAWHMWVPTQAGLLNVRPVETLQVDYVARTPARPSDLYIPFVETMWQHLSYEDICPLIVAICDSFHKMGTVVAKLQHAFASRAGLGLAASDFVTTDLEYLVVLARTVFDLLQEAISRMWKEHVLLLDPDAERQRKARALPDTFSRMVLIEKKELRTAGEIETKFGLSPVLAGTYAQLAPFFVELRASRDRLIHSGGRGGRIFSTERGFCVDPKDPAFREFVGWNDSHRYNENLVSVLPWIANIVLRTIGACNALTSAFVATITALPAIAPGYHVFVRGPSTDALINVLAIFEGASPWWGGADAAEAAMHAEQRIRERAYFLSQRQKGGVGDPIADWLAAEQIERG